MSGDCTHLAVNLNLKNSKFSGLAPIHFDGTAVSKPNSSSRLPIHNNNGNSNGHIDESPCPRLLNRIMEAISECMGLGLIGVDVIVEANTGRFVTAKYYSVSK